MTSSDGASNGRGTQSGRTQSLLPGYGVPDEITEVVVDLLTDLWKRGTLSARDRQLITLATLVAVGSREPLKLHVKNGLDRGLSKDDVFETIHHVAAYAGAGRSTDAYHVIKDVIGAYPDAAED